MYDDNNHLSFKSPLLNEDDKDEIISRNIVDEADYYNDEGIPLVNQVIFTNSSGSRVVLDDDQDDIVYLNNNNNNNNNVNSNNNKELESFNSIADTINLDKIGRESKKKSCTKGCCKPKTNQLKQEILNEEDEGIIKLNSNIGSVVTLDKDNDIAFIERKKDSTSLLNDSKCKKGCCGIPKIQNELLSNQILPSNESNCKKGCCDTKTESLSTQTSTTVISPLSNESKCKKGCCDNLDSKIIKQQALLNEGKCKKDCCDTKTQNESLPNQTSIPLLNESKCKKGCCGNLKVDSEIQKDDSCNSYSETKTYCCEICIDGHCCKSNCCEKLCCITYSLQVPKFLQSNNQDNLEKKPKKYFATLFSKKCGSFGFKFGYSELDENQVANNNNNNGGSVSIELLDQQQQKLEDLYLIIGGMTCADCVITLEDTIKSLKGVNEISTSLFTGKCKIIYSPNYIQPMEIQKSIVSIGFQVNQDSGPNANQINIGFDSLTTNRLSLLNLIDQISNRKDNIITEIQLKENSNEEYLAISYNIDEIGPRRLFNSISKQLKEKCNSSNVYLITDSSILNSPNSNNASSNSNLKELLILSILLFIPTIFVAFIAPSIESLHKVFEFEFQETFTISTLLLWIFATPVQFYVGKPLYISAFKTLVYAKKFSMDLLVMTSSSIAYFYSMINVFINWSDPKYNGPIFFETSIILLTLIILGRYLEYLAKGRASEALFEKISKLDSPNAILLDVNEDEEVIDKQLIEKGDILKVLPYSKFPTDGMVVKGSGFIDESIITGESSAVFKGENQLVFGGSTNQKNLIHIKASKHSNDTTLSNIVKLIQEGQATKPPFQNIADKVASYFVPSILVFSLSMFVIWFCLAYYQVVEIEEGQNSFTFAVKIAMAVMVISCPCAVSLATPTSIMVGSGVAAKHGILFKGGDVIESTHKFKTIVFDKTGTLTQGKIEINHFIVYDNHITPKDLFFYCGSTELASEHHLGKSIKNYAVNQLVCNLSEPESCEIYPGKGIFAIIEGETILVGNKSFMIDNDIKLNDQVISDLNKFESQSKTVVLVSMNDKLIGLISLQDSVKPEAKYVVSKLLENGIDCWIVSGDNQKSTESVAKIVGIDLKNTIHSALPIEKFEFIKKLQNSIDQDLKSNKSGSNNSDNIVAMVGDGVNDSLALNQSNVGISISSGTDIAIESSKVILMKNDLNDILVAIDLSKFIFRTIKRNLFYAFLYNLIGIPLSAGLLYPFFKFIIPPALSGVSELLSSLPVVLYSLSINTYNYKKNNDK